MPSYSVNFSWDEVVTVEADNKEEAIQQIKELMEDEDAHPAMNKGMSQVYKEIEENIVEDDADEMGDNDDGDETV